MKFDNRQFEQEAGKTMGTLDKLKEKMTFQGASKGLTDVQGAINKVNFGPLEGGITRVSAGFAAMATVAVTALSTLTNKAISAGQSIASGMLDPVKAGFAEYETNLNSIQTILANTSSKGTNLEQVNAALGQLNEYSDQTIYNFSEMARNIGTFTAAGVDLDTSVGAIKGISNVAAVSGSNAQQASTAMYQLSQALSTGTVKLQDWISVENAGMGGEVFQKSLIETARVHGVSVDKMIKEEGSFRATLSKGWLSSEILTETLSKFTGDLTDAQLKSMGYTEAQIVEIQKMAETSVDAATKVKTFTQLMGTLKETAGSGWAKSFELIIGDFEEARTLWTGVNDVFGGMIKASADARNKVLQDWKDLGGRDILIQGFKNAFEGLKSVLLPIKEAFREIFPPKTGQQLLTLTQAFANFTSKLKLSQPTMDNLKATFKGIFAVFSIVTKVIKGVVGVFGAMFGALSSGAGAAGGGILAITAKIGNFLVSIENLLVEGGRLNNFFKQLGETVSKPIKFISELVQAIRALASGESTDFLESLKERFAAAGPIIETISNAIEMVLYNISRAAFAVKAAIEGLFDFGGSGDEATSSIRRASATIEGLPGILEEAKNAWQGFVEGLKSSGDFLAPIGAAIKNSFTKIKEGFQSFMADMGVEDALALINTGFLIALYKSLRDFSKKLGGLVDSISGTFDNVSGVLEQVTANLKTMQAEVRSQIILQIAGALLLLSAALYILSKIDPKSLAISLGAVAAMLIMLVTALGKLEKSAEDIKSSAKLVVLTVALVGLGLALLAFSAALAILGNMEIATLAKGITTMGIVLAILVKATEALAASGGTKRMLAAAGALLLLSVAMVALAGAIKLYSMIDTGTLLEGGLKVVALLAAIGLVFSFMPPNMLASAAAIFVLANALVIMSGALKVLGSFSGPEMAKSLIMLGGSLLIIAVGLNAMTGAIGGAAAIIIFAIALNLLVPPLVVLSRLSLAQLGIAILALAGIFTVLGVAGYLLAPVVPVIHALAIAIGILGLAALAVGAGLLMFSIGLATLAASGAAGAAVLAGVVITMAELFPLIMHQFGLGVRAFAKVISESGPILVDALVTILLSIYQAIIDTTPKLGEALIALIDVLLKVLVDAIPKMVDAGYRIIIGVLEGIKKNYGNMARAATDALIAFMDAWAKEIPRLADAGAKAIIELINGISDAIDNNSEELGRAGGRLAGSLVKGIVKGVAGGASEVAKAAGDLAKGAINKAKDVLKIWSPSRVFEDIGQAVDEGFAVGINEYSKVVDTSVGDMATSAVDTMKTTIAKMPSIAPDIINTNPVITPVLDLSSMKEDAKRLETLLSQNKMNAQVSLLNAQTISASQNRSGFDQTTSANANQAALIQFEQNNYSPKALSSVEIYRQTKNQLALAKEALNV
jgi:tape measure domain-containing protein